MRSTTTTMDAKDIEKDLRAKLRQANKDNKELRSSEVLWAASFRYSPVALSIVELGDGRLTEASRLFLQMVGYAREELIGRAAHELFTSADANPFAQMQKQATDGASVFAVSAPYRTKSGEERDAQWALQLVALEGRQYVLAAALDVSAWKQRESELHQRAASLGERVSALESENTHHVEQKERLFGQIAGLIDQANLLKFDALKLRQMQQELNAELERLRTHAGMLKPEHDQPKPDGTHLPAQTAFALDDDAPGIEAEAEAIAAAADPIASEAANASSAIDATGVRLSGGAEQLRQHVAKLRDMAQRIETEVGRTSAVQNYVAEGGAAGAAVQRSEAHAL